MGEEAGAVNIDLTGVEKKLEKLTEVFSGDEKTIIKDIAIKIFTNTSFDTGKAPYQIAQDSVAYAMTLVDVLKKKGVIE